MTRSLDILARLIGFETVSSASNLELIAYVSDFLQGLGFVVHPVPAPQGEKAGLFAVLGPNGGGILLSAHSDVVPVTGQDWHVPPFEMTRQGTRIYGRGSTDMKGFLACALALAERAAVVDLHQPLKISVSYDEEVGCVGIAQMIGGLAPTIGLPDLCIVGEPTQMRVATGHKGKAAFRAVFHGQNGHSALAPQFTNALHLAAEFVLGLREIQQELAQAGRQDGAYDIGYATVHVGQMSGGTALNIVPDHAELLFEYRHLAGQSVADFQGRIDQLSASISARYPQGDIKVTQTNSYPGLDVSPQAAVVQTVMALAGTAKTLKVGFGTEAGYFDQLGIPTVVCGPGSMAGQGHKPDEYIEMSQLAACDAMMDRLLMRLCERPA